MAKQRINTIPPKRVQENARRALMIRAKLPQSKKAMKDEKGNDTTGVRTARKLIGGRSLDMTHQMKGKTAVMIRHPKHINRGKHGAVMLAGDGLKVL